MLDRKPDKPVVLIVDDTPTNIHVLAEALRAHYRVQVAGSGLLAFDVIARQGPPDLILLDVMMPGMDGYELCRRLKQDPGTQGVPVIFITAKSDTQDEERGLNLGAADYVTKPFHLPIVLARIRNHIQFKRQSDLLESLAWLDGLTNIPNRRRFDEDLETEWKRAQRTAKSLALVMFDIDYFKPYNDQHGHGAGDACLRQVANALRNGVSRPSDLLARYGGEEFVALLPDTDPKGARIIAERLRGQVESLRIPHGYSDASPWVTISVGVACSAPQPDTTATSLLETADRQLYAAKSAGRNRICCSA
jgi:diguanylate cyclase (GGDEF)-like protein